MNRILTSRFLASLCLGLLVSTSTLFSDSLVLPPVLEFSFLPKSSADRVLLVNDRVKTAAFALEHPVAIDIIALRAWIDNDRPLAVSALAAAFNADLPDLSLLAGSRFIRKIFDDGDLQVLLPLVQAVPVLAKRLPATVTTDPVNGPRLASIAAIAGCTAVFAGQNDEAKALSALARSIRVPVPSGPSAALFSDDRLRPLDELSALLEASDKTTAAWSYALGRDADPGHSWIFRSRFAEPSTTSLSTVYQFKDLLARKQYGDAWKLWTTFRLAPEGSAFFRTLPYSFGERDATGLIKDVYNAGRLAGHVTDAAAELTNLAADFREGGRVYALELAGRLLRATDQYPQALAALAPADELARSLLAKNRYSLDDAQRVLWFRLRTLSEHDDVDLSTITALGAFVRNKDYFDDFYESLVVELGSRGRWDHVAIVLDVLGSRMSDYQRVRTTTILGRALQLKAAQTNDNALNQQATKLLTQASSQSISLWYYACASHFLAKTSDLDSFLAAQVAKKTKNPSSNTKPGIDVSLDPRFVLARSAWEENEPGVAALYLPELAWILDYQSSLSWCKALSAAHQTSAAISLARALLAKTPDDPLVLSLMNPDPYATLVRDAATQQNLSPWIFKGLLRTESNFDPKAQSPVGAQGIAQFMPSTAKQVAKAMKLETWDLLDPSSAIPMSAYHLRELVDRFGPWPMVLSAYNAGPNRTATWRDTLPTDGFLYSELLPFGETRNYIRRIAEAAMYYQSFDFPGGDLSTLIQQFTDPFPPQPIPKP